MADSTIGSNSELLACDHCRKPFDSELRVPLIMQACGHSLCRICVALLVKKKERRCPACKTEVLQQKVEEFIVNKSLVKIIGNSVNSKAVENGGRSGGRGALERVVEEKSNVVSPQ